MEVWLGVVGVPVFHPLSLCLEVDLLSTVWFVTHPLLLKFFFVGYEPGFLLSVSVSSFRSFLEISEVAASISSDFLLHNYDLVLF